jgi:hypothetical protein
MTGKQMQQRIAAIFAVALFAMPISAGLAATLEKPKTVGAQVFLGPTVIGPNYKVKPQARSDGMMRLFTVDTPYGEFQFDGVEFTKMRLRELDAVAALEKMSQSDRFMSALGRAAFAPVKFGADLITNPIDTINRSMSGVANMFDRAGAGLANTRADRDNLVESLLGVSDTQRELAVELGVDPYTDFPPLATRLKQMAGAMASGGLPVKAGLALIPGGAGIAVSSVSSVDNAKDSLRSKTPAQLIAETRGNLQKLEVPDATTDRLVENRNYTPADLLIMSRALLQIGAQDTVVFVDDAAKANTRDLAFYQRRLAELMAARNGALGGLASFTAAAGHVVTISRNGTVVAVYPLDDIAWTELLRRAFVATSAQLRNDRPGGRWNFATTGAVSPLAGEQIKKLGWKIVQLKPLP